MACYVSLLSRGRSIDRRRARAFISSPPATHSARAAPPAALGRGQKPPRIRSPASQPPRYAWCGAAAPGCPCALVIPARLESTQSPCVGIVQQGAPGDDVCAAQAARPPPPPSQGPAAFPPQSSEPWPTARAPTRERQRQSTGGPAWLIGAFSEGEPTPPKSSAAGKVALASNPAWPTHAIQNPMKRDLMAKGVCAGKASVGQSRTNPGPRGPSTKAVRNPTPNSLQRRVRIRSIRSVRRRPSHLLKIKSIEKAACAKSIQDWAAVVFVNARRSSSGLPSNQWPNIHGKPRRANTASRQESHAMRLRLSASERITLRGTDRR